MRPLSLHMKHLHVSVASVIFCHIHTQSNTVIKNGILKSCNELRLGLYLHPSFREMGDGKMVRAGDPWSGLSMGMVYIGIRGRLNLIMEVNDSAQS